MNEDTLLPFDLPSVARKKLSVGFDGGQLSSDAGVLVLRGVEKKLGLAACLAACLRDRRNPERIAHPLEEMLRLRMFAIAAGYEDADDCDWLRHDPEVKSPIKDAINQQVESSRVLLICHDVCNGTKHLKLTAPRAGGARYHSTESTIEGGLVVSIDGWIDDGTGKRLSAKDLARQCVAEWERILQSHGLPIARMS